MLSTVIKIIDFKIFKIDDKSYEVERSLLVADRGQPSVHEYQCLWGPTKDFEMSLNRHSSIAYRPFWLIDCYEFSVGRFSRGLLVKTFSWSFPDKKVFERLIKAEKSKK